MGTIWACKSFANRKVRQKRDTAQSACIINVSSLLGVKGGAGASVYAATKAGVLGLTRALAGEIGVERERMRIRVNSIVPGYIETKMLKGKLALLSCAAIKFRVLAMISASEADDNVQADMSEGHRNKALAGIPLKRFGTPEEVADAAVFLAANEYANNCILNLDGGLSAT